tara:strand:- start:666 stop:2396 length:1731 start_codon:yes stop_codon:yes gene_type:complete
MSTNINTIFTLEDCKKWLKDFEKKKGRPLKILHVGNIANNAYLNAKLQRKFGIIADVICHDYKHIMGCPEWEDSEFIGSWGDDFDPDFKKACNPKFKRPKWFFTGTRKEAIDKIYNQEYQSKNYNLKLNYKFIKRIKLIIYFSVKFLFYIKLIIYFPVKLLIICFKKTFIIINNIKVNFIKILNKYKVLKSIINSIKNILKSIKNILKRRRSLIKISTKFSKLYQFKNTILNISAYFIFRLRYIRFVYFYLKNYKVLKISKRFKNSFPSFLPYFQAADQYEKIIHNYDLIQAYGLDPIFFNLINKKVPVIAFEHGTIRKIPFKEDLQGFLTKFAYQNSDHTLITNADNIIAAKKLDIKSFSFIPHPINEDLKKKGDNLNLKEKFNCNEIIFHPARHDWGVNSPDKSMHKGNDILIKGFSKYLKKVNPNALCICTDWGISTKESKKLIKELNIEDRFHWIRPQPNLEFMKYISSADIVADQFSLGAFGSLTPKALMLGVPVLIYLDESLHKWAFEETPPILNAQSTNQVFSQLSKCFNDKNFRNTISTKSKEWYKKYHSNNKILRISCYQYSKILEY